VLGWLSTHLDLQAAWDACTDPEWMDIYLRWAGVERPDWRGRRWTKNAVAWSAYHETSLALQRELPPEAFETDAPEVDARLASARLKAHTASMDAEAEACAELRKAYPTVPLLPEVAR
jgi:hypothetical protein